MKSGVRWSTSKREAISNENTELRAYYQSNPIRRPRRHGHPQRDRLRPEGTGYGKGITAADIKIDLLILGPEWDEMQVWDHQTTLSCFLQIPLTKANSGMSKPSITDRT